MTADFVNATSGLANSAANTVSVPWASTTANDLCLLVLSLGGLSTITDPTGWTAVDNLDESTTIRTKLWWYRCNGSESGSLAISWTGTAVLAAAGMVAYRGIYTAGSPIETHSVTGTTTTATSRALAVTGTITNTMLQVCVWCDVQTTAAQSWTPPVGMQEKLDASTTATPFLGLEFVDGGILIGSSAGLTGKTAVSAQSGTAFVGYNLGLRVQVSAQTDPIASGTAYRSGSKTALTVTEAFQGSKGGLVAVTAGQIWPRGVGASGTPGQGVPSGGVAGMVLTKNSNTDYDTGWAATGMATSIPVNAQTGTGYTLVLADAGKFVTMSNAGASTLTIPPNSSVAFPVGTYIEGAQLGAGQVTITPGAGVTLNCTPGAKVAAQYGAFALFKTATDTWLALGRLSS